MSDEFTNFCIYLCGFATFVVLVAPIFGLLLAFVYAIVISGVTTAVAMKFS